MQLNIILKLDSKICTTLEIWRLNKTLFATLGKADCLRDMLGWEMLFDSCSPSENMHAKFKIFHLEEANVI